MSVRKRTQGRIFIKKLVSHKSMSFVSNRLVTSYLNTQPYRRHHQKNLACFDVSKAEFVMAQVDCQLIFLSDFHKNLVCFVDFSFVNMVVTLDLICLFFYYKEIYPER